MFCVIVNSLTGEIEQECGICGLARIADTENLDNIPVEENHRLIQLTSEEYEIMQNSLHYEYFVNEEKIITKEYPDGFDMGAGESIPTRNYQMKIDTEKMTVKIDARATVDVPIEVDGIGGKEIIGYEEKPESIVVEKEIIIDEKI